MQTISLQPLADRINDSREIREVVFLHGGKLYSLTQISELPTATAGDTFTTAEKAMLQAVYDKLNALLARLKEP